jgi:glycosyltransferase involved in cell wall biosynthesis
MKIAFISRGCGRLGGIERYVYELALRFSREHAVTVITQPERFDPGCGARCLPVRVPQKPWLASLAAFHAAAGKAAAQGGYDLVHGQGADGFGAQVVTAHACHAAGWEIFKQEQPSRRRRLAAACNPAHAMICRWEKNNFSKAARVLVVAPRVREEIVRHYHLPIGSMALHHLGWSRPEKKIPPAGPGIREQFGIPAHAPLLGFVAQNPLLKGLEHALAVLQQPVCQSAHLAVGTDWAPARELLRRIHRRDLHQRVHFIACPEGPERILSALDIYLAVPLYEAFGLAVLEAMGHGVFTLMSPSVGLAGWLREVAPQLPPRPQPVQTAAAIRFWLAHPQERLARIALQHAAVEPFRWQQTFAEVAATYRMVARRP